MDIIDTHSHIYDTAFDIDREQVIQNARRAGVRQIVLPAVDSTSHQALIELSLKHPDMFLPTIGLHPTSVNENPDYRKELALVEALLQAPPVERFYAIGEVGLDLYWSKDFEKQQIEVFEHQIELSQGYNLPLIIHTRDAWELMIQILKQHKNKGLRGVMHAFAGSYEQYLQLRELGDFMFGIGGVVTYKNSSSAKVVEQMALSDIVLETDSPYLTPVPFRGKRNQSSYTTYICEKIAELLNISPEQVANQTTTNAKRVFNLK